LAELPIFPQFGQLHLPRQPLDCPQVHDQLLALSIHRVRIRIASDFRQGVESMFRPAVIAKRPVASVDLFELTRRVRAVAGLPPHLFPFYEQGVPVVDPRVNSQQPAPRFGGSLRHPSKRRARHYTRNCPLSVQKSAAWLTKVVANRLLAATGGPQNRKPRFSRVAKSDSRRSVVLAEVGPAATRKSFGSGKIGTSA